MDLLFPPVTSRMQLPISLQSIIVSCSVQPSDFTYYTLSQDVTDNDLVWLLDTLGRSRGEKHTHVFSTNLSNLVIGGRLVVLRHLASRCLVPKDFSHKHLAVAAQYACEQGRLDILQHLHQAWSLNAADVRRDNSKCLTLACTFGHVQVAKWLCETFRLVFVDLVSEGMIGFRNACADGHLDVIKYLHAEFELSRCYGHQAVLSELANGVMEAVHGTSLSCSPICDH